MEPFYNFYRDLISNPPKPFSKYGKFGEGVWEDLVEEGLTRSYPVEVLKKHIDNFKFSNPGFKLREHPFSGDPTDAGDFVMEIDARRGSTDIKSAIQDLNKFLYVYGYFVGGHREKYDGVYNVQIEPRFPTELKGSERGQFPFYHLAAKRNLPTIMKEGLVPRSTQTKFAHPGGRIYLLQTASNEAEVVKDMAYLLPSAKEAFIKKTAPDRIERYEDQNIDLYDMVLLKVKVPNDMTIYTDPMLPDEVYEDGSDQSFRACFVTQNIPPDYLKVVRELGQR